MSMIDPISTAEAARILGVSPSRVRQFIAEGRLSATKIGRDQLLEKEEVIGFSSVPRMRTGRPVKKMS